MNTAPALPARVRGPSLYEAVTVLERHYGAGFVHAPARWGTADGTIEYRQAHLYAGTVRQQLAAERLHLARASVMAQGGEGARSIARDDERTAHGTG